jgi:hypothetical protein
MYDLLNANINSCLETFYSMEFQSDNLRKEKYKLESWKCENSYTQERLKDYKVSDHYKRPNISVYNVNVGNYKFTVLRPAQESFTHKWTSQLPVKGCKNLGVCSVLRAFEQGRIFIMPHLLWHGAPISPVSSEGRDSSPLTTHEGMWRIYSNPDPHGVAIRKTW